MGGCKAGVGLRGAGRGPRRLDDLNGGGSGAVGLVLPTRIVPYLGRVGMYLYGGGAGGGQRRPGADSLVAAHRAWATARPLLPTSHF